MLARLIAIVFIFIATALAWMILGTTVILRTDSSHESLHSEVGQLWGSPQKQTAPSFSYTILRLKPDTQQVPAPPPDSSVAVPIAASNIDVHFDLDYRQKGLLWYSTYRVFFKGSYRVVNTDSVPRTLALKFQFPGSHVVYNQFKLDIDGREVQPAAIEHNTLHESFRLEAGASSTITISFESNGLDEWLYTFGEDVQQVRNFSMKATTNFADVDFPATSMSPSFKKKTAQGWELAWQYSNLLSDVRVGVAMPEKLNPGPWVSMVTYFAPVSLLLFFFLLFIFSTIKNIELHPMHYFFISASFFSFHLLLAYLVDHISVHLAFAISSIVSVALTVSYMQRVTTTRFALVEVGGAQFVYLILFSYTFFFKGYTGLTIAIASIATLFIVMQTTAHINWSTVFVRRNTSSRPSIPIHTQPSSDSETPDEE